MTLDWPVVVGLFAWGILLGIVIAVESIDRIERKKPKTLNLPLVKLQGIAPGNVMTLKHEEMELAVLNHADLEYIAEKAGMVLKKSPARAVDARKA